MGSCGKAGDDPEAKAGTMAGASETTAGMSAGDAHSSNFEHAARASHILAPSHTPGLVSSTVGSDGIDGIGGIGGIDGNTEDAARDGTRTPLVTATETKGAIRPE